MRILVINDFATPVGGVEYILDALLPLLRAQGHSVRYFASAEPATQADATCFALTGSAVALTMAYNPFAVAALRQELHRFPPDLIHLAMFRWRLSPAILPLLAPYPTVHHIHTYDPICPIGSKTLPSGAPCYSPPGPLCRQSGCFHFPSYPFLLQAHRHALSFRAYRVAVSLWHRQRLEADGYAIDAVIPNGVPFHDHPPAPLSPAPLLVCAARLVAEKGITQLLHAFSLLASAWPTLQLKIAGDGPQAPALRQIAATLPNAAQVTFLGKVPRHQLATAFSGAWLQIVPGTWEEPFGLVTIEAMMRATPVIAPARGASGEILNPGPFGLLYPNGDAAALAASIDRLLRSPDQIRSMGLAAQSHARENYSDSLMASRFLSLYQSLLS